MRPSNESVAPALAARLRSLRQSGLAAPVTQQELAKALNVSVPLISSWESPKKPILPPIHRLQDYATFFATQRSLEGPAPRLLEVGELSEAEGLTRARLESELLRLRGSPGGESIAIPHQRGREDEAARQLLLDRRSLMQHMLIALDDALLTHAPESVEACKQLLSLLRSAPWLVSSMIVSDLELSVVERDEGWSTVWVVSSDDTIEFEYDVAGPSFTPIVLSNLARGVTYRYLVPDTARAIDRAGRFMADNPGLEVRFLAEGYWRRFTETMDELVVYESSQPDKSPHRAYYRIRGRRKLWVAADSRSAEFRLSDLRQKWNAAKGLVDERG